MTTSSDDMMKSAICLLFLLLLALSQRAGAAEINDPGLITDHTVTSVGHDFYRGFTDRWEKNYAETITISERPSARWGSWISIKIGQDTLYQTLLFPNRRNFNKEIDTAVASVLEALSRRQIDKTLLSTGDLTGDEF